jgi:GWxTD domain-containing protein
MRSLISLGVGLLCFSSIWALDASLSFARFAAPQGDYVELYLHVAGKSLSPFIQTDSTVQGAVDVLILFEQGETVVKYDKFRLNSPLGAALVDFVDLKRYALPNGEYQLVVQLNDAADTSQVRKYRATIKMDFDGESLGQSDIQLLAAVTPAETDSPMVKSGLLMEPLPFSYYGRGTNVLTFYHEIYHSDQYIGEPFTLSYRIEKLENGVGKTQLIAHKRLEPAAVNPVVIKMDIAGLASGNYQLVVDVRDRERTLLSSRTIFFQRSNPLVDAKNVEEALAGINLSEEFVQDLNPEELAYSLRAIASLLPQQDVELVDILLRTDSIQAQRAYLYSFWLRENRVDPQKTYNAFMEVAHAVDDMFQSGFRHGFETDRGYVYIKYGRPSDMIRNEGEPSAPPYEIWSYNEIVSTRQNNVRFIFYNPSLAADDFILLHSDVIGERQNPQWQLELYRDSPTEHPDDFISGQEVPDNIGRRARKLLTDY